MGAPASAVAEAGVSLGKVMGLHCPMEIVTHYEQEGAVAGVPLREDGRDGGVESTEGIEA